MCIRDRSVRGWLWCALGHFMKASACVQEELCVACRIGFIANGCRRLVLYATYEHASVIKDQWQLSPIDGRIVRTRYQYRSGEQDRGTHALQRKLLQHLYITCKHFAVLHPSACMCPIHPSFAHYCCDRQNGITTVRGIPPVW